jgi:hypothetical protein
MLRKGKAMNTQSRYLKFAILWSLAFFLILFPLNTSAEKKLIPAIPLLLLDSSPGVLHILAFSEDPAPSVMVFLYHGDPQRLPFELPAGSYELLAIDSNGNLAMTNLTTSGDLPLQPKGLRFSETSDTERKNNLEDIKTVGEFFALNEQVLFDYAALALLKQDSDDTHDFADFFKLISELTDSIPPAITAFERLTGETAPSVENFDAVSVSQISGPEVKSGMNQDLVVFPLGLLSWLQKLIGFGKALEAHQIDARQTILQCMNEVDPEARQLLLNEVSPSDKKLYGIPDNVDEFLAKVASGALDREAEGIHKTLFDASSDPVVAGSEFVKGYADKAQDLHDNPTTGRAHKNGKVALDAGVKFYFECWTLAATGLSPKARFAVEKLAQSADILYDLSTKGATETLTKKALSDLIKSRLQSKLIEAGIPEGEIDAIISTMTDRLYSQLSRRPARVQGSILGRLQQWWETPRLKRFEITHADVQSAWDDFGSLTWWSFGLDTFGEGPCDALHLYARVTEFTLNLEFDTRDNTIEGLFRGKASWQEPNSEAWALGKFHGVLFPTTVERSNGHWAFRGEASVTIEDFWGTKMCLELLEGRDMKQFKLCGHTSQAVDCFPSYQGGNGGEGFYIAGHDGVWNWWFRIGNGGDTPLPITLP